MAPTRSACGPSCTRTIEKSAPRAASICPRTASTNGRPPPVASPSRCGSTANAPSPRRCTRDAANAGAGGPTRRGATAPAGWCHGPRASACGAATGATRACTTAAQPGRNCPCITWPAITAPFTSHPAPFGRRLAAPVQLTGLRQPSCEARTVISIHRGCHFENSLTFRHLPCKQRGVSPGDGASHNRVSAGGRRRFS